MDPELADDPEDTADAPDDQWDEDDLVDGITEIPIHGVAAVEGKPTGDGRMFADGALRNRDLPLPVRFEYSGNHGGDNSQVAVVGVIDEMWRQPADGMNEYRYRGRIMLNSDHGPGVVEGIIDGRYRGVSIEADDMTVDVSDKRDQMREDIKQQQQAVAQTKVERTADGDPVEAEPEMLTDEQIDELIDLFIGDGTTPLTTFSSARVCGFTIVPIPAYAEAYVALGSEFPDELSDDAKQALAASGCNCEEMSAEDYASAQAEFESWVLQLVRPEFAISEQKWDGSASRFSDDQWKASCVLDRGSDFDTPKTRYALPIKEPNGDLNRAAVHNAAARLNQVDASASAKSAAKAKLRSAYKQLGEDAPEAITASGITNLPDGSTITIAFKDVSPEVMEIMTGGLVSAAEFAPGTHDGPGWITNPRATARIRRYWVRGRGAAKIRWGEPGDFNRCRKQLVKYVANPEWLAGLCANMHKEAIGLWPGMEDGGRKGHGRHSNLVIVAAAPKAYPADWFTDPGFGRLTPITIDDDGHIYGHAAQWDECHIGMAGTCVVAPHSLTDYAYFRTGVIRTDEGDTPVGQVTMGTGHAGIRLSADAAVAHYDNTGTAVADVAAGEDAYGIWINGALRELDENQLRALRAASLSGDWRDRRGNLELVGLLAVNVPGFPIPRTSLAASGFDQESLVAAGIVEHEEHISEVDLDGIFQASPATVAKFVRRVTDEMKAQERREQRLAAIRDRAPAVRALRLERLRSKQITKGS